MNRSIIKPSNKFKKNASKKKILTETVNDYLYRLNTTIENSYKNNKDSIIAKLPTSFNISDNIDYKNFQIEVYYNIVEILEKKGYDVKIRITEKDSLIQISWKKENDNEEINIMKDKLKKIIF